MYLPRDLVAGVAGAAAMVMLAVGCQPTGPGTVGSGSTSATTTSSGSLGGDSSGGTTAETQVGTDGANGANDANDAANAKANSNSVAKHSGRDQGNGEALEVSFEDLVINMQPDIVFRPWMMKERAKSLDGKRIRILGVMHGAVKKSRGLKEFILLRNKECKFGPGGQADHLIQVTLSEGVTTSYTDNRVEVEGVLEISPFNGPDGNTWSLYNMVGNKVKTLR